MRIQVCNIDYLSDGHKVTVGNNTDPTLNQQIGIFTDFQPHAVYTFEVNIADAVEYVGVYSDNAFSIGLGEIMVY